MTTHPTRTLSRVGALALALVLPFALVACGDDDDAADTTTTAKDATPQVSDVWARAATAGGNGAAYMTIKGDGTADALVTASVPADVAGTVELHETTSETGSDSDDMSTTTAMSGDMTTTTAMDGDMTTTTMMGGDGSTTTVMGGGMMSMRPVEAIDIPADGEATLEPGGYHVMILDLKKDLVVGDTLPITLTFEKAGEVEVTAEVRES